MLGEGYDLSRNLAVAAAGDPRLASSQGGSRRRSSGARIDLNWPVLDVLTDRYSPNIGIRAYGKDPSRGGLRGRPDPVDAGGGLSACAKPLPGKGHSRSTRTCVCRPSSRHGPRSRDAPPPLPRGDRGGCGLRDDVAPALPRPRPLRGAGTFRAGSWRSTCAGRSASGRHRLRRLEMGAIAETSGIGEATVRTAAAATTSSSSATPRPPSARPPRAARRLRGRGATAPVARGERARVRRLREARANRFGGAAPGRARGEPLARALATRR